MRSRGQRGAAVITWAPQAEVVPTRRAIRVIAYLWLVLATALLTIDILTIVGEPPPADMFDARGLAIAVAVAPWLIAVLATAACLSEIWASPRSHAPVWWLVVIMAAYGYWLIFMAPVAPVAHWTGAGAVLATSTVVVFLDIIDLFGRRGLGRAATGPSRIGLVNQGQLRQP